MSPQRSRIAPRLSPRSASAAVDGGGVPNPVPSPVGQGFSAFQQMIARSFVPMQVTSLSPSSFWSKVSGASADHVQVSDIVASRHTAVRSADLIDPDSAGYLKVNLQLAGTGLLVQDEREALLHPGDMAVYDTQRPFSLAFEDDSRSLVLMFPKDAVGIPSAVVSQLTAVPLSGRTGVGNLVVPFLAQLANNLEQLKSPVGPRLAHNVLDLMGTVLSSAASEHGVGRDQGQRLLQKVIDHIDIHLSEPGLSPGDIAAAHFISTRHLHGLFQAQGTTVASWIRERRLDRCARDLHDGTLAEKPISAIAARWGFPDSAHFSRVFKAHSGLTPSEFRAVADARAF